MIVAATASSVPLAVGFVVAAGCFVAWVGFVVRPWTVTRAEATLAASGPEIAAHPALPAAVQAVVQPHVVVAAPDDAAVAAAVARRVPAARPELHLVVSNTEPAPAQFPRSA
jgi:hypothetical protein